MNPDLAQATLTLPNPPRTLLGEPNPAHSSPALLSAARLAQLFIEALEAYLWHYEQGNELVTGTYVSSLMQLIEQNLAEEAVATEETALADGISTVAAAAAPTHHLRYKLIKAHILHKSAQDGRYAAL